MTTKQPLNVGPELVGEVVVIQVFERDQAVGPSAIKTHTLEKHVGILEYYAIKPDEFQFKLAGVDLQVCPYLTDYVEMFVPEGLSQARRGNHTYLFGASDPGA